MGFEGVSLCTAFQAVKQLENNLTSAVSAGQKVIFAHQEVMNFSVCSPQKAAFIWSIDRKKNCTGSKRETPVSSAENMSCYWPYDWQVISGKCSAETPQLWSVSITDVLSMNKNKEFVVYYFNLETETQPWFFPCIKPAAFTELLVGWPAADL